MLISNHGNNSKKKNNGIVFLDLLIAIFVITMALYTLFKGISVSANIASKINKKVLSIISVRNRYADNKTFIFIPETPQ